MDEGFWDFWDNWIGAVWDFIKVILTIPFGVLILLAVLFFYPIGKIGDWRLKREIKRIREGGL